MNYIYDIYANLNKKYYDIYDWEKKDKIIHIKKIPILKIKHNDLKNIIKNEVNLDIKLYNNLKNKTAFFNFEKNICLCIFTDGRDEILIQISKNGNIIKKSSIHFTDTSYNFNTINNIKLSNIEYKITNTCSSHLYSRKETENKIYLIKNIDNLNKEKLTYLYFECFNKKVDDLELIKKIIINEIVSNNEKICTIINNFFKLIYAT